VTTSSIRSVAILGSTGSIGRQTIEVIQAHPDELKVVALVAGSDEEGLQRQAAELGVEKVGLGSDAAIEMARMTEADVVVNAIVGAAGLRASLVALEEGKTLALANKESLVAAGDLCMTTLEQHGGRITAVDSEHAALTQCLKDVDRETVERIVITASGGPFRTRTDLSDVTTDDALAHPTWTMGRKITIDSATLMNKGLEVIEAHYLFGFDYDDIGVIVHPQSVVHGIVEFVDGSQILQAGPADMRIPIQAALEVEQQGGFNRLDLKDVAELTFEAVDRERFPALDLAYEAGRRGQTFPAVLNAANEVAVEAFLDERLRFAAIARVVEATLEAHEPLDPLELADVERSDRWAREYARGVIEGMDRS
jgi:1-deoxy-D-xylulose-5-phosphate reductoisomerase